MPQEKIRKVVDLQDFVPQRSSTPKQVTKHPSPREGLGGPASSSPPRWATADAQAYTTVENNAIKNRMAMTAAEQALWEQLRSNRLGVHFRRQHVIGMYVADFVSLKNHLIIEVDGEYHSTPAQQLSDAERTRYLQGKDFRVIRLTNQEVLTDIESVMSKIIKSLILKNK
jgi:very-short-patch-repair endonuclease